MISAVCRFTECIDPGLACDDLSFPVKASEHVGVGHRPDGVGAEYPDPLPKVGSAGILCREHSPLRIVPEGGHVSENSVKPPRSEDWRVFHEHERRSYFANDPGKLGPESGPLSVEPVSSSGLADVLTGKASRYHVATASPSSSVKGPNVVPDRERRENALVLPGGKYSNGEGLALDGADALPIEKSSAEDASSCP